MAEAAKDYMLDGNAVLNDTCAWRYGKVIRTLTNCYIAGWLVAGW